MRIRSRACAGRFRESDLFPCLGSVAPRKGFGIARRLAGEGDVARSLAAWVVRRLDEIIDDFDLILNAKYFRDEDSGFRLQPRPLDPSRRIGGVRRTVDIAA